MAPFLATLVIPTAGQFLGLLAPLLGLGLVYAILKGIDGVIDRCFPALDWQRQLGWFDLRAERRASAVLRWLGYLVQAGLAAALYGMAWGGVGLREVWQWSDPTIMGDLTTRLPVFFGCLVVIAFYLFADLLPRLRRDYEREELEKFREQALADDDADSIPSRLAGPAQIWSKSPPRPPARR